MFSSTKTDIRLLQENIETCEPILTANIHDPDAEQEIRIFHLEKFKWKNHPNIILPSGIMLHHINAFVSFFFGVPDAQMVRRTQTELLECIRHSI